MILLDRAAGLGIMGGGAFIVLAVIGILLFVVLEAYPLFRPAKIWPIATTAGLADVRLLGVDEYRDLAYALGSAPSIRLFDPVGGKTVSDLPLDSLAGASLTAAAASPRHDRLVVGTSDGRIQEIDLGFSPVYHEDGRRTTEAEMEQGRVRRIGEGTLSVRRLAFSSQDAGSVTLAETSDGRIYVLREVVRTTLVGEAVREHAALELGGVKPSRATALAVSESGRAIFVGMEDGGVQAWSLEEEPRFLETFQGVEKPGVPVTALAVAIGGNTVIVGGGDGSLAGWFRSRDPASPQGAKRFMPVHRIATLPSQVVALAPSGRDRGFVSADGSGAVRLHFLTNERTLLALAGDGAVRALAFAPKADGILVATESGEARHYGLHNPHPEISLRALFGKIWYEGYDRPDRVWQSTGGSDEFEGKFNLVPLLFGTIKGTLYALLFAVPIALLAAIYASQFLHHRIRNVLKPAIEIMAALPSVVLGLIAGLFLAPRLETIVPGTIFSLVLLPVFFLGASILWKVFPARWTDRFPTGTEVILLIPIAFLAIWSGQALGPLLERALFAGDFRHWLNGAHGVRYDQRNCIVVGFAMGFAVIPIIFTICEDALSAVPQGLVSGSIACGASRWQTALQIVLPAAGSGIFSAIMIGFGRAVGETMIVLMATGNTPIMDWSIFNGMRTLSANIAVEVPEAPYRGTLYRVLFFSGFLLFLTTFIVNTAAEVIRLRLKRKYGNY